MGENNGRSVGTFSNQRRLQDRIQSNSSKNGHKTDKCTCKKFRNFKYGSKKFNRERCCRTCSIRRHSKRFLQYIFPCPQKNWRYETSNQSQTFKQVSPKATFQDGFANNSVESSKTRRLGNLSGSERCVYAHSDLQKTQKVFKVLCKKQPLSTIHSTTIRSDFGTKSLYKSSVCNSGSFKSSGHSSGGLFGRLVHNQSAENASSFRSRENSQSSDQSGLYDKFEKVYSNANAENSLHRGIVSVRSRSCLSNTRESNKIINDYTENNEHENTNNSKGFSSIVRNYGILHRNNSQCSSFHATTSNSSFEFLETIIPKSRSQNSHYQTSKISSEMVVQFSKHYKGQIPSTLGKQCDHNNRCFYVDRLGGSHGFSDSSRDLVRNSEKATHKLLRNGSSDKNSTTFSETVERQECTTTLRQLHSSTIHKQARGDQINTTLSQNMGSLAFVNSESNTIEGGPHRREVQHPSRPTVTNKNQTHRVDVRRSDCSQNISETRDTNDRLICINSESQEANILHMVSSSGSLCSRCTVNSMEQSVRLCVPSNMPDTQNSSSYESISVSNNTSGPTLAKKTMVSRTVKNDSRLPNKTTSTKKSTTSAKHKHLPPKSGNIQSGCMATIDKLFKKRGFSKETRNLMSASWRSGTQKDYSGKFKKFCGWCSEREIDPYSASLTDTADFLTSLYTNGLQYRTIAGYRSMLSTVLPPVEKIPIGQHPYIIRLLKGVFNSRPPKVKLLPEWDLTKVLEAIQKSPFEPMKKADLKYITWKTVFLISITTFRRCSDIQALRLGEGNISVHSKGVFFVRDGLAKQDRPGHFGAKIFVPGFSDDKLLDPKRALTYYLKRTDEFRGEDRGGSKLFLSISNPHKPVSCQTISNWIVNIIQFAYDDKKKSVKAHSTRAIGPSWALYKGASMKSIMEAADWSRESTFTKFYLRNLTPSVLSK